MTFGERLNIFWRVHFLQAFWNYKGMQHLGCLCALRPVLRRLYSGDEYLAAEKRQAQYFNTHPYFAPVCFGVVAKLEEELKAGTFPKADMIPVLKNRMSGPLAAVGDAFFWETLRPILGSLIVFVVYAFGAGSSISFIFMAGILVLYIVYVEWIRWAGFQWGYRHGLNVVDVLKKKDFHGMMRRIRNAGAVMLGVATVIFVAAESQESFEMIASGGVLADGDIIKMATQLAGRGAVLALLLAATLQKWSPTTLLYLTVLLGAAMGWYL